jgi:hypothetical protein
MSKCGGNSLWNKDEKIITVRDNDLVAIDNGNIVASIDLSDLNIPYSSVLRYSMVLKPNDIDIPVFKLNYGITFITIKARYGDNVIGDTSCKKYTIYKFKDGTDVFRFGRILMLSNDCEGYIDNVLLSNPFTDKKIYLDIMIAYDNGIEIENIECDCH